MSDDTDRLNAAIAYLVSARRPVDAPVILIDVDGVCADLHAEWIARYCRDWRDNLSIDRVTAWEIDRFVKPECGKKIYEYLDAPDLYENVHPLPGSREAVELLRRSGCRVVFVSSVTSGTQAEAKSAWMFRHGFLRTPQSTGMGDLIFASRKGLVRGDVMVDDYHKNLLAFSGRRILVDKPYNRVPVDGAVRVRDLAEAAQVIVGVP